MQYPKLKQGAPRNAGELMRKAEIVFAPLGEKAVADILDEIADGRRREVNATVGQ